MMKNKQIKEQERLETGIEGLDVLLCGGFRKGGTYLILGTPGTGKTVLANQICFHEVNAGGAAVYVTLLAESHSGMIGNLSSLDFFDPAQVSHRLQYLNGYGVLEREGLEGLMKLLGETIQRHQATVLFIDGVASADALAGSTEGFKRFVHNLNSVIGMSGCTTFLLSSTERDSSRPDHTMVDGIVHLTFYRKHARTIREIEIVKFRGSPHFHGKHYYFIDSNGIEIFPRTEQYRGTAAPKHLRPRAKINSGIAGLDALLDGGLTVGSVTSLLGPVGSGKTTVGSSFLVAGARKGERGLLVSFYEHPDRLIAKLEDCGIEISTFVKKGMIEVQWRRPDENVIDQPIDRVLRSIGKNDIKRLFVDGIGGFKAWMVRPERITEALSAFGHELRALGVTSFFTEETDLSSQQTAAAISNFSAFTDNIIEFRHVDLEGRRSTCLSMAKTRESDHDRHMHELVFGDRSVTIGRTMRFINPILPPVTVVSDEETGYRPPTASASRKARKAPKKTKQGRK